MSNCFGYQITLPAQGCYLFFLLKGSENSIYRKVCFEVCFAVSVSSSQTPPRSTLCGRVNLSENFVSAKKVKACDSFEQALKGNGDTLIMAVNFPNKKPC